MGWNQIATATLPVAAAAMCGGCDHDTFEPTRTATAERVPTVRYTEHRPTHLDGFVGNGRVDTQKYCKNPVRTELRVSATDVLIGVGTALVYTPHTLTVECPTARGGGPGTR